MSLFELINESVQFILIVLLFVLTGLNRLRIDKLKSNIFKQWREEDETDELFYDPELPESQM